MKMAPPRIRVDRVSSRRPLRRKVLRSESSSGRGSPRTASSRRSNRLCLPGHAQAVAADGLAHGQARAADAPGPARPPAGTRQPDEDLQPQRQGRDRKRARVGVEHPDQPAASARRRASPPAGTATSSASSPKGQHQRQVHGRSPGPWWRPRPSSPRSGGSAGPSAPKWC